MQTDDVLQMTQEIATHVVAMEVADEDFVSQDQSVQVSDLLRGLLRLQTQSTEHFEASQWGSVFWREDNARPDRVTETFNELYDKSNEHVQNITKTEIQNEHSSAVEVGLKVKLVEANMKNSHSNKRLTKDELEKLHILLKEHKSTVQWKGEAFIPKALKLSRVNMAALRVSSVIAVAQVSLN